MNNLISEHLIETLDRKYTFTINSSLSTFMLDLQQFINFLNQDSLIKDFTNKLTKEVEEKVEQYCKQLESERVFANEIKDLLISINPQIDDNNIPESDIDHIYFISSFRRFNLIIKQGINFEQLKFENNILDDNSDVAELIKILTIKVNECKKYDKEDADEQISYKLRNLKDQHEHTYLTWKNYCRISAGIALIRTIGIIERINPKMDIQEPTDLTIERFNELVKKGLKEKHFSWITDATYGVVSNHSKHKPNNLNNDKLIEIFTIIKEDLRRIYESIRQEINTTKLRLQLLDRYKIRCQWYNQEPLRSMVENDKGEYERNREDLLTRDLALYLFDQGVIVLYRSKFGKHEMDLVQIETNDPMLIEVKVYKHSDQKREILSGIAQTHSYLCNYEGFKHIHEAYYVIYRLGGPIYEFPRVIHTNRFNIYPILIDLGLSGESGRKQAKPIIINEDEVLITINMPLENNTTNLNETTS